MIFKRQLDYSRVRASRVESYAVFIGEAGGRSFAYKARWYFTIAVRGHGNAFLREEDALRVRASLVDRFAA